MTIPLVDLHVQYRNMHAEIDAAVREVLDRGDFILGAAVRQFEEAFASFIGVRHCIGVASGTDALFLTLRALGIGQGDHVLLPANTFIATALAVTHVGATPVLADIDPLTHTIDMNWVRRRCPAGIKAIIPVHLYGQPADMDGVLEWARAQGVVVIEDAAQAHGAVHRLGRCGTLGRAAAFSFYPAKNLGAYGDGGAVCTDDDDLAEHVRLLRNWGSTEKYVHRLQGFNSRLDTLQAAVLLVKLRRLAEWNDQRRLRAEWYSEALRPLNKKLELPRTASWSVAHVYHLFVVQLHDVDRDTIVRDLHSNGIGAGIHYPVPLHFQEAYTSLSLGPGSFPVAEATANRIMSLPLFPEMTLEQVKTVARALCQLLEQVSP